jgi:Mn-dependent DtxR family transcriptional regulator
MDPETSRFTDRLALLFESDGLPPTLRFDELAEDLAVSKASASAMAQRLARGQGSTKAIGEGRRTLPLARR